MQSLSNMLADGISPPFKPPALGEAAEIDLRRKLGAWAQRAALDLTDCVITIREDTPVPAEFSDCEPWFREMTADGYVVIQSGNCTEPVWNRWKGKASRPFKKDGVYKPRQRYAKASELTGNDPRFYINRCRQCPNCRDHKSEKRRRDHVRLMMDAFDATHATWFKTTTFGWHHILVWLKDHDKIGRNVFRAEDIGEAIFHERTELWGVPIGECIALAPTEKLKWSQWFHANEVKRLRRQGCPPFIMATAWEAHKSGDPHSHPMIHETTHNGRVLEMRQMTAGFIQASGKRPPKQLPKEGNHTYWKRRASLCFQGWNQWKALANDPSPEARKARLGLPFQPGRFHCTKVQNGKHASIYAGKAARYAAKETGSGRFFTSPTYSQWGPNLGQRNKRERPTPKGDPMDYPNSPIILASDIAANARKAGPKPPTAVGPSRPGRDQPGAPLDAPASPPTTIAPQSGVAERLLSQEYGRKTPIAPGPQNGWVGYDPGLLIPIRRTGPPHPIVRRTNPVLL